MADARRRLEVEPDPAAGAATLAPSIVEERPRAGRTIAALGGLALIIVAVLGGWAIFHRWVRGTAPAVAALAAPMGPAIAAKVVDVEGVLERRTERDRWVPVTPGEQLRPDDTIRTPAGARAVLAVGDASRIDVTERTELSVREITAAVQRLRLARGRIALDYQQDGARVLVVESARGDAIARTHGARFSILATGAVLSVATESGVVRLESGGAKVDVAAGQQSIAIAGALPSRASPIPIEVLLRVGAAASPRATGLCAVVRGKVEVGAEVLVDGRAVEVGPDGRFEVRVPREGGNTHARVLTRDVAGRVVRRTVPCVAGPGAEVTDFAVRWHDGAKARVAR